MRWLAICTTLGALLLSPPVVRSVGAATIVVDDDGAQCPNAVVATIQGAVTLAAANDVIRVCAGTYSEEVTIGAGKTGLRITGQGSVRVTAPFPTISPLGFDIAVADVQVDRLEIDGFGLCGIRVSGDRATIEHNDLHDNHSGLCVEGTTGTKVRGNVVQENVVEGIVIANARDVQVAGNRIFRHNAGVVVMGDADGTVEHNLITRSRQVGIAVGFSAGTVVRNNTVRSGFGFGVVIVDGVDVDLASNSIQDVTLGVGVDQCLACTLSRNSVMFNNPAAEPVGGGILLRSLDASAIVQNAVRRNGLVDCAWDATGSNLFQRNACGGEVPPGAWD